MLLEEANARFKKSKINEEQLWALNSLYLLLDLSKDDFCKIVDCVGLNTLLDKQRHYNRLLEAEEEFAAKEKYLKAKSRLKEIEVERGNLEQFVNHYERKS